MDELKATLVAHARGELPAGVAVMRLCQLSDGLNAAKAALADAEVRWGALPEARALLTPDAFALVKRVLGAADHERGADPEVWAATFDRLAAVSADSGSALYALGDEDRLATATEEVVRWLRTRDLIGPASRVLEIGCGSGRFQAALAREVAFVAGLDVSGGMAVAARRRGATTFRGSGRDLAAVRADSFDLVLAVDSWPYLVNAGVHRAHLNEARSVLRRCGRLAVLNWSYDDETDAPALAEAHDFKVEVAGERPFRLWDGRAFVFRRG